MRTALETRAIVLRWRSYGDSDKIVTFLTETAGKLTGIGKGAKRSRRRFPNSLEPLARVRLRYTLRRGASLAFLESCHLRRTTAPLTAPGRFAYAGYLTELADRFSAEGHPVPELFSLLEEGLLLLESGAASGGFLRGFEVQMLTHTGYEPQLERCVTCKKRFPDEAAAFFDPTAGGFACASCRRGGQTDVPIACSALAELAALKRTPLVECRHVTLHAVRDAGLASGCLLGAHLQRPLQSLKLIEQMGSG